MPEAKYALYVGKLVRLELNQGILKDLVGILLSEDSQSIRISELYPMNHFYAHTIPKAKVARVKTLDLVTGNWPEG